MKDVPRAEAFVVTVAVVVVSDGQILNLLRARDREAFPGIWETVSGRVEPGEQPEEAALRELLEEAGISADTLLYPLRGPVDAYVLTRLDRPMCVIVYRADVRSRSVVRSIEHDEHAWSSLDEVCARVPARLGEAVRRALALP